MTYQKLTLPEVTEHINGLYKIWNDYPSSSLSLEIHYYENIKQTLYEKR